MERPYGPPSMIPVRKRAPKSSSEECPVPNTHDKIEEAHYFLHQAAENYHWPEPFRWNLNAFLQSLRSTTFYLQAEKRQVPNFDKWYPRMQAAMRGNDLLKRFDDHRDVVVHRRSLEPRSSAALGVFDYERRVRMALDVDVDALAPSETLPRRIRRSEFVKVNLRGRRSEGWQAGIERTWIVPELGDEEVLSLGLRAFSDIASVVAQAHAAARVKWSVPDECQWVLKHRRVLLEAELPAIHRQRKK
jgi:hypothetical protein